MKDSLFPYKGVSPQIGADVLLAPGAKVIGAVTVEKGASIWYNTVVRGDENSIIIGEFTNIQDCGVVHCEDHNKCSIGKYVTVGHHAIVHGCIVQDWCLIGMGAIILNGAEVGEGSIIGAGAVVTAGTKIPPYSVAVGSPARVIKNLDPSSKEDRIEHAMRYRESALENMKSLKSTNHID